VTGRPRSTVGCWARDGATPTLGGRCSLGCPRGCLFLAFGFGYRGKVTSTSMVPIRDTVDLYQALLGPTSDRRRKAIAKSEPYETRKAKGEVHKPSLFKSRPLVLCDQGLNAIARRHSFFPSAMEED
jgi:hypothetical protein